MLPPVKPRGRKLRERRHVINGIRCGADRCGLRRRNRLSVTSNVGPNVASCHHPVGFQNAAMVPDQRLQAAASYSLRSPPRIGRRRIGPWTGSGIGDVGRGGRSPSARCGRAVL